MVVHNVIVLVPDVVVPIQDGHRVHVLIARIGLLHKGVPQVGDGAEQDTGLHVRIHPVDDAEDGVPAEQRQGGAVVRRHAEKQLLQQAPLLALHQEGQRAQAGPVQGEAGRVDEERAEHRAVEVQVGVHVVDVVVPSVVDLHVRNAVAVRHHPVERRDPPLHDAVEALKGPAEEALVVVPRLVDQGVRVAEELEARAAAQDVVDGERGELQAVDAVPPHGPEEERGREGAEEEHPGDVGVVPRVLQQRAAQGARDAPHELRDPGAQRGEAGMLPDGLQREHRGHGHAYGDRRDRRDEEDLQETPQPRHGVRQPVPREGLPAQGVGQPAPRMQKSHDASSAAACLRGARTCADQPLWLLRLRGRRALRLGVDGRRRSCLAARGGMTRRGAGTGVGGGAEVLRGERAAQNPREGGERHRPNGQQDHRAEGGSGVRLPVAQAPCRSTDRQPSCGEPEVPFGAAGVGRRHGEGLPVSNNGSHGAAPTT
mmetsp:Transcript_86178/g.266855  ORF Transcript_86178/g.266855 Transcript_86178/m.266855 type:complete len:484 (-) Transcript_86178:26-1477(-)